MIAAGFDIDILKTGTTITALTKTTSSTEIEASSTL